LCIEHLVRKGNIVVYPKYQNNSLTTPAENFTPNAAISVKQAIDTLLIGNFVKPRIENYAYIGHSFGGVISSNLTLLADSLGLPQPKALMPSQPGHGGFTQALLPSYKNFKPELKMLMIVGDNDAVVGSSFARLLYDSAIYVNPEYKNLATHFFDNHGYPNIEATHNEPLSWSSKYDSGDYNSVVNGSLAASKLDAVDFYCYWKLSEALINCAFYNTNCNYAFCQTNEQKNMGNWSDNIAVKELKIEAPVVCSPANVNQQKKLEKYYVYYDGKNQLIEIFANESDTEMKKTSIEIFDSRGALVYYNFISGNRQSFFLPVAEGIYYYRLSTQSIVQAGKLAVY
jgi:hypothetical protein